MSRKFKTLDANEAVAYVAYRLSDVIVIYPITPSSPMGEWADAWAAEDVRNIWGNVSTVVEMQSEGGAAGAVHGSLQAGSLTTTFTASQGLMLMLPNMYKIAGELTPAVFHIAARSLACQGLSIFGDHSDVMAARSTGWAMLCSNSVQEAHDFAIIAQAASLEARLPFLHFFDGFRTSHEVAKIEMLNEEDLPVMIDPQFVRAFRHRKLTPDNPVIRGTAQNPDVYFQARESVNRFYLAAPAIVQKAMDRFGRMTGRNYKVYEYYGDPNAERVVVLMGSGAEAAQETVDYLTARGEKVGLLKVRLYRPFDGAGFAGALPASTRSIAVLDRTKEPGSVGEPLFLDCLSALQESWTNGELKMAAFPKMVGGRYGLSSKEFTPTMVKAVFDNLSLDRPKNHFTVGILDDVTHSSLDYDADLSVEPDEVVRCMFYGLGSDGTVGANKNSIKIIGENTDNHAQGYFVYDSKKAGAITVSHLRFGPRPIHSSYLIEQANFVACHQMVFVEKFDMLRNLKPGGVFLLNSPVGADQVWEALPVAVQQQLIDKQARFYVIDANEVAQEANMGRRINTVMQVCFFAISGVLPREQAIAAIKQSIVDTYGRKGEAVVQMNLRAIDQTLDHLHEVKIPTAVSSVKEMRPPVPAFAPDFVRSVLGEIIAGRGDALPVSAFPCDGTYPSATSQYEKRSIALEIPDFDPEVCIQCGKCALVCPHAVIRCKIVDPQALVGAPAAFKSCDSRDKEWRDRGWKFVLQVSPEDCTGCALCVDYCPAKNKRQVGRKAINMESIFPLREQEKANWDFFLKLPEIDRRLLNTGQIKSQQLQQPLFEFSGACAGCGETPYLKLLSQLFGDRALIANATGCSSIYGGNLPTTPWAKNAEGRGPAWSNSLFEDNAEFGLGFRLAADQQKAYAEALTRKLAAQIGDDLAQALLTAPQQEEAEIFDQRDRVTILKQKLAGLDTPEARELQDVADMLVKKSVWIVGGDGWAYDIGFGGLDHVLSTGANVNLLVLDTEVYSNTGGQKSKATPRSAVAKFSAGGKPTGKKDLGLIAMSYGNVYVASVAMGAKDEHTVRVFLEAEAYNGPSLIIAYSHCIAHGIDMTRGMQHQDMAVKTGQWLLYRYNPDLALRNENPFLLTSREPKEQLIKYLEMESRFKMLTQSKPDAAKELFRLAQEDVKRRWQFYDYMAGRKMGEPVVS